MPEPKPTAPAANDLNATVTMLNRLFVQALLQIGKRGNAADLDAACRLAAQGWSLLRHDRPRDAERLNGVMHSLTGPRHATQPRQAAKMPDTETVVTIETSTERK